MGVCSPFRGLDWCFFSCITLFVCISSSPLTQPLSLFSYALSASFAVLAVCICVYIFHGSVLASRHCLKTPGSSSRCFAIGRTSWLGCCCSFVLLLFPSLLTISLAPMNLDSKVRRVAAGQEPAQEYGSRQQGSICSEAPVLCAFTTRRRHLSRR